MFALIQVGEKRFLHLFPKIDDVLVSTLASHLDCEIIKIYVADIQTDTLRHTNTGSQQKCQKRKIAHLRLIVELHLTFGHFGAVLHLVKQNCDLVGVQTHDFLVMELRHRH